MAKAQQQTNESLTGKRGNILSSDGSWIAGTKQMWSAAAIRSRIQGDTNSFVSKIAPMLFAGSGNDMQKVFEDKAKQLFSNKSLEWIPLQSRISDETKNLIDSAALKGIEFTPIDVRYYPESSSTAHVLGFVGKDDNGADKGYFGLEGYYDTTLQGREGFVQRESDIRGIPIVGGNSREVDAADGVDLLTSIDRGIQFDVEKYLQTGIESYGAKSGNVIVADPKTGSIIAMASFPTYDPYKYFDFSGDYFRNPSISDVFEPGSIFKVVVMASALDAGAVEPETRCDICSGQYRSGEYSIQTWNDKYYPDSTMTDVIVHSDNVGMVYVGKKLGADKLSNYLNKFGFGQTTGIDLQGEVSSTLRQKGTWSDIDLATSTFGQGIAVTPIQMLSAVSAIANKGYWLKPHIVSKLVSAGIDYRLPLPPPKKIISPDAAKKITDMMVSAVDNGEAKWTKAKGFVVAGKTGTAQIPVAGHYDPKKTVASFVGFAPAYDPKFVMLVMLNEPNSSQWASETAAPLWFNIAHDLFVRMGIQPQY